MSILAYITNICSEFDFWFGHRATLISASFSLFFFVAFVITNLNSDEQMHIAIYITNAIIYMQLIPTSQANQAISYFEGLGWCLWLPSSFFFFLFLFRDSSLYVDIWFSVIIGYLLVSPHFFNTTYILDIEFWMLDYDIIEM